MQPNGKIKEWVAKRLFGYGQPDEWSYVDKFTGPTKDIKLLGMYSGITYACINAIAEEVGKYQPYLYTLDNQGKQITRATHPFLTTLQRPNPDLSMYQLFEGSASFVEQFGEFFWYMVGGQKTGYQYGVKEIYLLRPDKMGITVDKDTGEVIGYTLNNGQSKIPFAVEEIKHFMTFNPKNPYRGFSTVEAAIDYIQTEEEVSRFTRNYFRNNAAMSGVLNVSGKVARDKWNKFVRQWRERYQGVDNAGKVALVRDSQITFTPTGSNISDMQLTDLKQTTIEQIMMMFRIPKGIFGMESEAGLGRASVETLEYIFAKRTIDPKLSRFDDFLQRCMDDYYKKDKLTVGHQNIIPSDKEFELQRYNLGVDRWLTRKEIRAEDPDTANTPVDGSEQLFVPINMVTINDPATPTTATSSSTSSVRLVAAKKKVVKTLDYSKSQKEQFRLSQQHFVNAYSAKYKKAAVKVMEAQKERIVSKLTHFGKGILDDLVDTSEDEQAFQAALMPVLQALMVATGANAFNFAGGDPAKFELTQSVIDAIQKSTAKMAQNFDTQTLEDLNDTLIEGITAGEGVSALSNRVEDVYSEAEGYRADRIAMTESQNANNSATLDAYQQTDYVTDMEWYANPGACPYCEELDGTVVGVEDNFVNQGDSVDVTDDGGDSSSYVADYGDVETPPLHPNCECTIIPVIDTSA